MKLKHLALSSLFAMALVIISQPAHALIEFRAGYGVLVPSETDQAGLDYKAFAGITGDVLVRPPITSFGFGLRYESQGFKQSQPVTGFGTIDLEYSYERVSLLVNYNVLSIPLFKFDLVGGIGLSESLTIEFAGLESKLDDGQTINLGGAATVGLGLFGLTGEVGYHLGKLKSDTSEAKLDGIYVKALVGIGF